MPVLPSIVAPALLSSIRNHPHLPHHTWYIIAATALSVLNRSDEIPKVYKHAVDYGVRATDCKQAHEEQLEISRRMREALVKGWSNWRTAQGNLIPQPIVSWLTRCSPSMLFLHLRLSPPKTSKTSRWFIRPILDQLISMTSRRGQAFFDMIYMEKSLNEWWDRWIDLERRIWV